MQLPVNYTWETSPLSLYLNSVGLNEVQHENVLKEKKKQNVSPPITNSKSFKRKSSYEYIFLKLNKFSIFFIPTYTKLTEILTNICSKQHLSKLLPPSYTYLPKPTNINSTRHHTNQPSSTYFQYSNTQHILSEKSSQPTPLEKFPHDFPYTTHKDINKCPTFKPHIYAPQHDTQTDKFDFLSSSLYVKTSPNNFEDVDKPAYNKINEGQTNLIEALKKEGSTYENENIGNNYEKDLRKSILNTTCCVWLSVITLLCILRTCNFLIKLFMCLLFLLFTPSAIIEVLTLLLILQLNNEMKAFQQCWIIITQYSHISRQSYYFVAFNLRHLNNLSTFSPALLNIHPTVLHSLQVLKQTISSLQNTLLLLSFNSNKCMLDKTHLYTELHSQTLNNLQSLPTQQSTTTSSKVTQTQQQYKQAENLQQPLHTSHNQLHTQPTTLPILKTSPDTRQIHLKVPNTQPHSPYTHLHTSQNSGYSYQDPYTSKINKSIDLKECTTSNCTNTPEKKTIDTNKLNLHSQVGKALLHVKAVFNPKDDLYNKNDDKIKNSLRGTNKTCSMEHHNSKVDGKDNNAINEKTREQMKGVNTYENGIKIDQNDLLRISKDHFTNIQKEFNSLWETQMSYCASKLSHFMNLSKLSSIFSLHKSSFKIAICLFNNYNYSKQLQNHIILCSQTLYTHLKYSYLLKNSFSYMYQPHHSHPSNYRYLPPYTYHTNDAYQSTTQHLSESLHLDSTHQPFFPLEIIPHNTYTYPHIYNHWLSCSHHTSQALFNLKLHTLITQPSIQKQELINLSKNVINLLDEAKSSCEKMYELLKTDQIEQIKLIPRNLSTPMDSDNVVENEGTIYDETYECIKNLPKRNTCLEIYKACNIHSNSSAQTHNILPTSSDIYKPSIEFTKQLMLHIKEKHYARNKTSNHSILKELKYDQSEGAYAVKSTLLDNEKLSQQDSNISDFEEDKEETNLPSKIKSKLSLEQHNILQAELRDKLLERVSIGEIIGEREES